MTELFHNFGFVFLWSVLLTNVVTEKVLPPENVRLSWSGDLYQELSWTPPKHSLSNCSIEINSTVGKGERVENSSYSVIDSSSWLEYEPLNGGFLNISIKTVCNEGSSKAEFVVLDDPDLKLNCAIVSSSQVHCSWDSPPSAQLQFFYNVAVEHQSKEFTELRECPHYSERRSGCDLPVKLKHSNSTLDLSQLPMNLLLKGTLGNRTLRNIHYIQDLELKLPPLKWTVEESKDKFFINWIPPPALNKYWQYNITYTLHKCDKKNKVEYRIATQPPHNITRQANCSYDISMRGLVGNIGGTNWTSEKHFDVVSESNPALWALVLIPMALAVLMVLTLFWGMRNKDRIWPKIPTPNTKLFQDLLNNNNKANFYLPKVEEECEVTLVIDPKQPGL